MSTSSVNIDRSSTGKTRWHTLLFLIVIFQSAFFGSIFICFYSIVTLNVKLMVFLTIFSFIQSFATRSQFVIDLVNKYIDPLNYYKTFKRIYQQQIPQQQLSFFCFHPHSVLSYCIPSNMNADGSKMSRMAGLASRFLLAMPFIGLQLRLWGVQSVNAKNIIRLMKKGKPLGILPGGFQQATLTTPNQLRVYIKDRKGFIKYALQYGYTIHPVLTYNEHKAFWTFDGLKSLRLLLNKIKIPGTIFGMGFLWLFLPMNLDIINIVGKGIRRQASNKGKDITKEQINQFHGKYMKQIERMHQKYREQYGQSPLVFY